MNKNLLISSMLAGTLISGCATQSIKSFQAFQPEDLNPAVKSGKLVQKTNSFFVINDSSSSMSDTFLASSDYKGTKLDVEKDLLNKFNKTIPNIPLSSGLLSFGFGPCQAWGSTQLNQPMQKYSPAGFDAALGSLQCSSGGTPLANALTESIPNLNNAPGNIALLIFSDGMDDAPSVPVIDDLKSRYGDKLCVYTVWVGNDEDAAGQANLEKMATTSGCGLATDAATISNPHGMADFVTNVFFKAGTPPPVTDCSKLDDDKDGVNNCTDKCPNSLPGVEVSALGCWIVDVKFDNDKDIVKPKYFPKLDKVIDRIKQYPNTAFEVQGHTSNTGSYKHNMDLSERRAQAVKRYLSKAGHLPNISAHGYGWNQPIDSNETEEGRANNRRVQLEVDGKPQQPSKKK